MSKKHTIQRVRHELVGRDVTVAAIEMVTPRMRRIHFESPELEGFHSPSADDHIAIFIETPDGEEVKRHYTPRSFDASRRRLAIDFATHEAGPATDWAENARVGDVLSMGGPRSSLVVSEDFDWYLLLADETALPALARRVEMLRSGVPVLTIATIFDAAEKQQLTTQADWRPVWLTRGEPSAADLTLVRAAIDELELPSGDGFVWIGGESVLVRGLRASFIERGHPREWIHASGYWKRGVSDVHEVIDD